MSLFHPATRRNFVLGSLSLPLFWGGFAGGVEVAYLNEFEGPTNSWALSSHGSGLLVRHERIRATSVTGNTGVESIVVSGQPGTTTRVQHEIGRAPVIDELRVSLRIQSSLDGVELGARVVLPRSGHREGGLPLTVEVLGDVYQASGSWQELEICDFPIQVKREARMLRTNPDLQVDEREAYVDQILLLLPGAPKPVVLQIDDLAIEGIIQTNNEVGSTEGPALTRKSLPELPKKSTELTASGIEAVRLMGARLFVGKKPLFPRVIEHNGEDLQFLARSGFNVVWLKKPPTEKILTQAKHLQIRLLSPPPNELLAEDDVASWSPLLAWGDQDQLTAPALDTFAAKAQTIRQQDQYLHRPLLATPLEALPAYARIADILVSGPRGSLHQIHQAWSENVRNTLASLPPGKPVWIRVELDHSRELAEQLQFLAPAAPRVWRDVEQVAQEVRDALRFGAAGILFSSHHPLTTVDPKTSQALVMAELLNRELQLIEPWLVGGQSLGGIFVSGAQNRAEMWLRDRVRLVAYDLGSRSKDPGSQAVTLLTIPGVSELSEVHTFSPGGLVQLTSQRVAGGIGVPLADLPPSGYLILADDLQAITAIRRRVTVGSGRAAQLARAWAIDEVATFERIRGELNNTHTNSRALNANLMQIKAAISKADLALAANQHPEAYQLATSARLQAEELADTFVNANDSSENMAISSPLANALATLPEEWKLATALQSLSSGTNQLPAGDFEDLPTVQGVGWHHTQYIQPGRESSVELTAEDPQHGLQSLRLRTISNTATGLAAESVPGVWVTSPPVTGETGTILDITGWVRVAPGDDATFTGLRIQDTLGGNELAIHIHKTSGWQPFRMIRAVAEAQEVRLHFALQGVADAAIDGVMVRSLLVRSRIPAAANNSQARSTAAGQPQ